MNKKRRLPKEKSIKKLKKKLWDLQSEYIRRTEKKCFTCGKKKNWKELQAGHFIHKDCLDFERKNIHAQCVGCNHFRSGNRIIYAEKLEELYGFGIIQELRKLGDKIKKWKVSELEEKIEFLKQELNKLK
jgi:hypothetical protein